MILFIKCINLYNTIYMTSMLQYVLNHNMYKLYKLYLKDYILYFTMHLFPY